MSPEPAGVKAARSPRLPGLLFGLLILFVLAAVALDWRYAASALSQVSWLLTLPALACTALSFLGSSTGFTIVNQAFGLTLPARRLAAVGFVNMAANNLITLGGAAGYSVSAALLKRPGTEYRTILAAGLFNSWLYFLFGVSLLPLSLGYLLAARHLARSAETGLGVVTGIGLLLALVANLAVFRPLTRQGLFRVLARMLRRLLRRDLEPTFARFNDSFSLGISSLRRPAWRPWALAGALVWDWAFCILALWFCFAAFGLRLQPAVLASGFFVSIAAGAASMIPGGLGVQEGSLAGVYAMLGAPLTRAVLAAVLFRIVYYVVPYLAALFVYWQALRLRQASTPDQA